MARSIAGLVVLLSIETSLTTTRAVDSSDKAIGTPKLIIDTSDTAIPDISPDRLIQQRAETIRVLVGVVSREEGPGFDTPAQRSGSPKRTAITCLGIMRANEPQVLRVLWKDLTYRQAVTVGTLHELLDPGSYFPAAAALVKIGKPACDGAWRELEITTDPVRRDLAAYVLQQVEGTELARLLVERRLEQLASVPELLSAAVPQKSNLESARQWLIDRSKDASSGGKPPTIGGVTLVDWSSQSSRIATTAPAD